MHSLPHPAPPSYDNSIRSAPFSAMAPLLLPRALPCRVSAARGRCSLVRRTPAACPPVPRAQKIPGGVRFYSEAELRGGVAAAGEGEGDVVSASVSVSSVSVSSSSVSSTAATSSLTRAASVYGTDAAQRAAALLAAADSDASFKAAAASRLREGGRSATDRMAKAAAEYEERTRKYATHTLDENQARAEAMVRAFWRRIGRHGASGTAALSAVHLRGRASVARILRAAARLWHKARARDVPVTRAACAAAAGTSAASRVLRYSPSRQLTPPRRARSAALLTWTPAAWWSAS